jgi:hypothetical protein
MIQIYNIQLGNPKHTPIRAHVSSHGSPFTPFDGESGPFHKTHGPASTHELLEAHSKHGLGSVPFLQAPLLAMLMVQYLSPNELIDFTVNYNSGPYYVLGTFNLNQDPTTKRSLNDIDGIKEYMPSRHQQ